MAVLTAEHVSVLSLLVMVAPGAHSAMLMLESWLLAKSHLATSMLLVRLTNVHVCCQEPPASDGRCVMSDVVYLENSSERLHHVNCQNCQVAGTAT